jgi:acetyl esterase/lipase
MHSGLRWHFHQLLSAANKDVGILILAYGVSFTLSATLFVLLKPIDLIPIAQYPRQLQQAISLRSHLIRNLHKSPSNIALYGDAARGNLATAILSDLSHPHPSTSTPITSLTLPSNLRGVVLSSPWLSFSCTAPPFIRNAKLDLWFPATSLK